MMSIFDWFQSVRSNATVRPGDTDTVRRIVDELDHLDADRHDTWRRSPTC